MQSTLIRVILLFLLGPLSLSLANDDQKEFQKRKTELTKKVKEGKKQLNEIKEKIKRYQRKRDRFLKQNRSNKAKVYSRLITCELKKCEPKIKEVVRNNNRLDDLIEVRAWKDSIEENLKRSQCVKPRHTTLANKLKKLELAHIKMKQELRKLKKEVILQNDPKFLDPLEKSIVTILKKELSLKGSDLKEAELVVKNLMAYISRKAIFKGRRHYLAYDFGIRGMKRLIFNKIPTATKNKHDELYFKISPVMGKVFNKIDKDRQRLEGLQKELADITKELSRVQLKFNSIDECLDEYVKATQEYAQRKAVMQTSDAMDFHEKTKAIGKKLGIKVTDR